MMGLFRRRPRPGAARRLCLLDRSRGTGLEPLGFCAWDVVGEPLGAAPPRLCFREDERPSPATPLWVERRGGAQRILCLCTPAESAAVGERLAHGAAATPCGPEALGEVLARFPLDEAAEGDDPVLPWVTPWPRAAILEGRAGRSAGAPAPLALVGLLFDPPGRPLAALRQALSDPSLWRGLPLGGHRALPLRVTPLLISMLLPLPPGSWRGALAQIREELGLRTGAVPGWFPPLPEDLPALCGQLRPLQRAAAALTPP